MESEPMLTPRGKSPQPVKKPSQEEDQTHDAAQSRTASSTHYQRAILAPFQVAWQPFFPGVLLRAILWPSSWRHTAQGIPSAFWIALCCTDLQDRPPRPEFDPFSGILRRHRMRIWLRFSQVVFPALYPPSFGRSTFLLSTSWASFLATIHSISFPIVFCIVRIRYRFSLLWSFPGFEIGLR